MDLWHPPTDQPHLFEWWRPLIIASRRLRERRGHWPIHLDEMLLTGRVDRPQRPSIWVYKHAESRGELYLDSTGQAYKFTRTPRAKGYGRFNPCDIEVAIWRADLPRFVQPVFHEQPMGRASYDDWEDGDDGAVEPSASPEVTREPRRRGHLTVIAGGLGRPLAG